jgi:signal transduction histidine kinase
MLQSIRSWLERVPGRDPHERTTSVAIQLAAAVAAVALVVGLSRGVQVGAPAPLLLRDTVNLLVAAATVVLLRAGRSPLAWRVMVVGISGNYLLFLAAMGLEFNRYELLQLSISLTAMALLFGRRWLWLGLAASSAAVVAGALRDAGYLGGAGPLAPPLPAITLPGETIAVMAIVAVFLDRFGLTVRQALDAALARERELARANEALREEIAAHRRTGAMLVQAQKLEAVARFAGGVAHDFNNVVGVVRGHTELLRESLKDRPQAVADLNVILQASDSAAALTRQLLAFSRKQLLAPRVLDLNATVTATGRMLGRLIGSDVILSLRLAPGLWPVRADPGQIEQVIMNLAVNARDAMPDGGTFTLATENVVLDEAGAALRAPLRAGDHVRFTATDTGTGIDAEALEHLFEPFFTTKEEGKGTGLGLSTVYGIVTQSGGLVSVESRPGHGSTFEILLPRDVTGTPPA